MGSQTGTSAILIALMVMTVVAVDFLFLRDRFWARLAVNASIVAVFFACYLIFLKR